MRTCSGTTQNTTIASEQQSVYWELHCHYSQVLTCYAKWTQYDGEETDCSETYVKYQTS